MAVPAIIWRNPNAAPRERLWSQARRDRKSSLYIVMRLGAKITEWEGLPSLEVIRGSGPGSGSRAKSGRSRAKAAV